MILFSTLLKTEKARNRIQKMSIKKCIQCDKEQDTENNASPPMMRCSRCHLAVYCSKDCQIVHWRGGHKRVCGIETRSSHIPWVLPNVQPMKADPEKFELMDFTIATPSVEEVSGCCAFCAMITHNKGDNKMYFIPEIIDCDNIAARQGGNEPYPANNLIALKDCMDFPPYPSPKDNYTRHKYAPGPNGIPPEKKFVGCCLRCAKKVGTCTTQDDLVFIRHFLACDNMLMLVRETTPLEALRKLSKLNPSWMERRLMAAITLYSRPDLSKGKSSIAGEYSKEPDVGAEGKKTRTKGTVTYNFLHLESMAFPDLFPCGTGIWKENCGIDLSHYTLARLNSVSSKWRKNPDYVMFSIHRLIAYGLMKQSQVNRLYEIRGEGFLVHYGGFLALGP